MTMRVSEVSRWLECEEYALADPAPGPNLTHVATIVGTAAHAILAGLPYDPPSGMIQFDVTTPRHSAIMTQAHDIARAAREVLERHNLTIISQEEPVVGEGFIGTLDIRATAGAGGDFILDLKTGRLPHTAWMQVGGYCYAAGPSVAFGGVLHVPRVPLSYTAEASLTVRPAKGLAIAWAKTFQRIQELQRGMTPQRSPGAHCKRCPLWDCPVRAEFES